MADSRRSFDIGRLVRFGLVGVFNTGVYYSIYLLLRLEIPYLAAHVVAFVVAMEVSYFVNCRVTFRCRPGWRTFALFPLSNLTNFVLTTVGLAVAVQRLHLNQRIAPIVVALAAIPVTFVVARHIMVGRTRPGVDDALAEVVIGSSPSPAPGES